MSALDNYSKFSQSHKRGQIVRGPITKIVPDMGFFVRLDPAVDGLVHLADLHWEREGGEVILDYELGQIVDTVILRIEPDKLRVSLGIKQLSPPPPPRKPWRRRPPDPGTPRPADKHPPKAGPGGGASQKMYTED